MAEPSLSNGSAIQEPETPAKAEPWPATSPATAGREVDARERMRSVRADLDAELLAASTATNTPSDVLLAKYSRTPNGQVITNIAGCHSLKWLEATTSKLRGARLSAVASAIPSPTLSPENQERVSGIGEWYAQRQAAKAAGAIAVVSEEVKRDR